MKNFIILYKGPATPPEEMNPEKVNEIMAKWREWMEQVGDALLDMGKPMANGHSLYDDGTEGDATDLSGYSIIQAEDAETAMELVEDHPFLTDDEGKFCIEIHELMEVPGM